jgi:hypothetical protein
MQEIALKSNVEAMIGINSSLLHVDPFIKICYLYKCLEIIMKPTSHK